MQREFPQARRGAGVLMHITSLDSNFGTGDFGPEARKFIAFLKESSQRYWQILPITAVQEADGFSPYSSISAFAGNTLLISPETLLDEGLISLQDLKQGRLRNTGKAEFVKANNCKRVILDKAFKAFRSTPQHSFEDFVHREGYWLDDFVAYMVLKNKFGGRPWYEWPDEFKLRNAEAIEKELASKTEAVLKAKWHQFLFFRQWMELKAFANQQNIQIVGDVPFYVNYDSVDVWSNPHLFKLRQNGEPEGVAGVPPDYFNADGQLWGMPVYRWDVMESDGFEWWKKRLRKNIQLFDIVRLDHFRAFADYWEVPGGEKTAKHGEWKPGPGANFFNAMKNDLGQLPFIAEDLGDITPTVLQLRDAFNFPGMKVLQFAFGDNMPMSEHIPHNYSDNFFAYTGTHDNNTSRGWYTRDLNHGQRLQLEKYYGRAVGSRNVARALMELVYASVARTAIVPMQDILGLAAESRMNTPASTQNNWLWRIQPHQLKNEYVRRLHEMAAFYGRSL
jgi:4-alpha-glucanotransferase